MTARGGGGVAGVAGIARVAGIAGGAGGARIAGGVAADSATAGPVRVPPPRAAADAGRPGADGPHAAGPDAAGPGADTDEPGADLPDAVETLRRCRDLVRPALAAAVGASRVPNAPIRWSAGARGALASYAASVLVAGAAPDRATGAAERDVDLRVGVDDGLRERARLGVEVDGVPGRQRAAPVEDDGVERTPAHEAQPRTTATTRSTTASTAAPWWLENWTPTPRFPAHVALSGVQTSRAQVPGVRATSGPGRHR